MKNIFYIFTFIFIVSSCKKDSAVTNPSPIDQTYTPTPYSIQYPFYWSYYPIPIPTNNPLTVEGIALGRKLFYDPILSQNNTISCATCHNISFGFTDNGKQFSNGLHGEIGKRNAMPIFNLGWYEKYGAINHRFFWDGGSPDIESQVFGPITNPIEMNENLFNVVSKLKSNTEYPTLFKKAFGKDTITSQLLAFAIAQFERTIISYGSKYDKGILSNFANFTQEEKDGMSIYTDIYKGDCWHCHTISSHFFTDFGFHNNGIQQSFSDSGLARITRDPADMGKFKTPSLRNLVFTAPYMHDGRFKTLEEVVEFYNSQAYLGANKDPFITSDKHEAGLNLSDYEKRSLVTFLKTLSDSSFISNPQFSKP
jgi:cytochrome c peroxidase